MVFPGFDSRAADGKRRKVKPRNGNTTMIPQADKERFQRIANLDAYDIAAEYGCDYSGDSDPINHDGFFFDARDWERYGYASIVEFWTNDDGREQITIVECRTVNKPSDMGPVWQSYGIGPDDPIRDSVQAQIEAVKSWHGSDPVEDFSGPYVKRFNLADWPNHWRIWRSVEGWIKSLGA